MISATRMSLRGAALRDIRIIGRGRYFDAVYVEADQGVFELYHDGYSFFGPTLGWWRRMRSRSALPSSLHGARVVELRTDGEILAISLTNDHVIDFYFTPGHDGRGGEQLSFCSLHEQDDEAIRWWSEAQLLD